MQGPFVRPYDTQPQGQCLAKGRTNAMCNHRTVRGTSQLQTCYMLLGQQGTNTSATPAPWHGDPHTHTGANQLLLIARSKFHTGSLGSRPQEPTCTGPHKQHGSKVQLQTSTLQADHPTWGPDHHKPPSRDSTTTPLLMGTQDPADKGAAHTTVTTSGRYQTPAPRYGGPEQGRGPLNG